jgi:hypothetical protein
MAQFSGMSTGPPSPAGPLLLTKVIFSLTISPNFVKEGHQRGDFALFEIQLLHFRGLYARIRKKLREVIRRKALVERSSVANACAPG